MKNIKTQLIINVLIIIVAVVLFKGVSYSVDNEPTKDNKSLLIKTGNMQVVLKVPADNYEFLGELKSMTSDVKGMEQSGYSFTITNTGDIPIEYYEIRLVNQENKVSTMPYKYLRFTINKDNGEYEKVKNLGDNDGILYYGYNLDINSSSSFNLKMWIDEQEINALGKSLFGALEITLYQKYDVYKNYVLYDGNEAINVPIRTSIYSPISLTIPYKDGYVFKGWETKNGNITYQPGDTYHEKFGTTLYAKWEKLTID